MAGLLDNILGKPYTLGELMKVDQGRQDRAAKCAVRLDNTFYTLKEETPLSKFKNLFTKNTLKVFYITLKLAVTSDTGNTHYVYIQIDPDFSLTNWAENRVKIYCDCADFMYRSAYLLDKRDSLFKNEWIRGTLGQAMTEEPKGKRGVTLLCKHSFAAFQWLMANYKQIMSTL